jgi:hypothetical protein
MPHRSGRSLTQRIKKIFSKPHFWLGPLAGGLIGLIGGPAGVIIGIVLGYLIQEVLVQLHSDRSSIDDYENSEQFKNSTGTSTPQENHVSRELSPWELLGVKSDATPEEIKSAYRKLATQFHPDALQGLDEEHRETAARAFMQIKEAYKKLTQNEH